MGGNCWVWPPVGKPDEAPRRLPEGRCSCRSNCGGCLVLDDVRRRRWAPVVTWVEEGDARLMKSRREEKLASSLESGRRRELIAYVKCQGRVAGRFGAKPRDEGVRQRIALM